MAKRIGKADRADFAAYLRTCSDAQVQGVFDKERQASRLVYANLARDEAQRRGIQLKKKEKA